MKKAIISAKELGLSNPLKSRTVVTLFWVFSALEQIPWKWNFGFEPLRAVISAAVPAHTSVTGTEGLSHTHSAPLPNAYCPLLLRAPGWSPPHGTPQRSLSSFSILQHSGWTEMMTFNNGISKPSLNPFISRSKSLPFHCAPSSLCQHMPGPRGVFLTFCLG